MVGIRPKFGLCPIIGFHPIMIFLHMVGIYPIMNLNSSLSQSLLIWSIMSYHPHVLFDVDDGGYIKALLRWVCSCQLQHIIWELDLETIEYLGTYMPQWMVSSFSIVGLPNWPLIKIFHECSTLTHSFTFVEMY